ncbi:MAG: hypothetical protein ACW99A_02845 [Candidatus Kariarchaeaceae archaeon]|jgi:hypothetical protein
MSEPNKKTWTIKDRMEFGFWIIIIFLFFVVLIETGIWGWIMEIISSVTDHGYVGGT